MLDVRIAVTLTVHVDHQILASVSMGGTVVLLTAHSVRFTVIYVTMSFILASFGDRDLSEWNRLGR